MTTTLRVRASATDRAWQCAESLRPEIAVDTEGPEARLGSAFHEWSRRQDPPDLEELAERYSVSADDLERLVAYAMVAERALRKWFAGADAERSYAHREPWDCPPYDTIELAGSVDRFSKAEKSAAILDYKTGRVEGGYVHQQRAYAFLAAKALPDVETVYSATVYVGLGHWTGRTYKRGDLDSWWFDLKRRLANGLRGRGQFSPGSHCGFCPRRQECPGVRAYTGSALALIGDGPVVELTNENKEIVGPELADTLRKVRYVEGRCNEFRDALREAVARVGGEIPAGDGKVLKLIDQTRRELDAMKAWPVLAQRISEEDLASACSISLRKCQDAAANAADRGGKGEARAALLRELEEAEAVIENTITQLREVAT